MAARSKRRALLGVPARKEPPPPSMRPLDPPGTPGSGDPFDLDDQHLNFQSRMCAAPGGSREAGRELRRMRRATGRLRRDGRPVHRLLAREPARRDVTRRRDADHLPECSADGKPCHICNQLGQVAARSGVNPAGGLTGDTAVSRVACPECAGTGSYVAGGPGCDNCSGSGLVSVLTAQPQQRRRVRQRVTASGAELGGAEARGQLAAGHLPAIAAPRQATHRRTGRRGRTAN